LARAFIGEIYTTLTSSAFYTDFIAWRIVRVAILVFPAPVGAQTSIFPEELKAHSNTIL